MLLAKRLLEQGESETVLQYLDNCKKFGTFLFRILQVRKWKKKINKGEMPNFGGNIIYYLPHELAFK